MTRTSLFDAGSRRQSGPALALVLALLASALGSPAPALGAIPPAERAVLVALYNQAGGAAWTNNAGWSNPATGVGGAPGAECAWYGVTCDAGQNHVTELYLMTGPSAGNNLTGSLPDITPLTALQSFVAGRNHLTGAAPALTGLGALRLFVVNYNQLTGPLPALAGHAALQGFFADHNQLSGAIPPLTGLTALQGFYVNNNGLSGTLPALTGLTALQAFAVGVNNLSGPAPSFAGLTALRLIELENNQLTGTLPALTGLTALQAFYAGRNGFTGAVPALGGLPALQAFDVSHNALSGTLPPFGSLPALTDYEVQGNRLGGPLPALSGLTGMVYFNVGDNQFTGPVPSLAGLTALESFYLYLNQFAGPMALPPSPSALLAGASNLCANQLQPTGNAQADQAWDVATGMSPVLDQPGWLACQGLDFGRQPVGSISTARTITIAASASSGAITITTIAATGDFMQSNNCPPALSPPQSCAVDVTFAPAQAGVRTGALLIAGSTATSGPLGAQLPLRGTGVPLCSLDVDGNGIQDALTDGLIILRAAFGLTGTSVTGGAVGANATRTDWVAIRTYLNESCGANFAP